jgi:hypothetical protein
MKDRDVLMRHQLRDYLVSQGLWSEEQEKLVDKLNTELVEDLTKLKAGGIKLSEAKDLAIQIRAKRQLKNLLWYPDPTGDHNIGVDLSNARKPDAGDRASAVKLIKYMNDNGFKNTIELKNAIYDKWNKLKK